MVIALIVALTTPTTIFAYTPKQTNYADTLKLLGLFAGTCLGHTLDKTLINLVSGSVQTSNAPFGTKVGNVVLLNFLVTLCFCV